jgi:hypothetical protein
LAIVYSVTILCLLIGLRIPEDPARISEGLVIDLGCGVDLHKEGIDSDELKGKTVSALRHFGYVRS